ncbi:MAG: hypothetical protein GY794_00280, partial [bacterium]|nr:hypothetical protein [bacterium]
MRVPIKLAIGLLLLGGALALCEVSLGQTTAPAPAASTQPDTPLNYSPPPAPVTPADHAVARAIAFLLKQIGSDGQCAGEYPEGNPRHGGVTALCVYALLTAEVDYRQPEVKR